MSKFDVYNFLLEDDVNIGQLTFFNKTLSPAKPRSSSNGSPGNPPNWTVWKEERIVQLKNVCPFLPKNQIVARAKEEYRKLYPDTLSPPKRGRKPSKRNGDFAQAGGKKRKVSPKPPHQTSSSPMKSPLKSSLKSLQCPRGPLTSTPMNSSLSKIKQVSFHDDGNEIVVIPAREESSPIAAYTENRSTLPSPQTTPRSAIFPSEQNTMKTYMRSTKKWSPTINRNTEPKTSRCPPSPIASDNEHPEDESKKILSEVNKYREEDTLRCIIGRRKQKTERWLTSHLIECQPHARQLKREEEESNTLGFGEDAAPSSELVSHSRRKWFTSSLIACVPRRGETSPIKTVGEDNKAKADLRSAGDGQGPQNSRVLTSQIIAAFPALRCWSPVKETPRAAHQSTL